jgi:integrase
LAAVRKIEDKGTIDTASRAKQVASQVFRFAVAEGICDFDPTRDLKGALTSAKINHRAALMGSEKLAGLLKDIDAYKGSFKVVCLMKMSAYLFQRPGEMRKMEWSEINFEKKIWELPAAKMKMGVEHIVPLSTQVMQLLHELQPHAISNNPYVFPGQGQRGSPSSDATVIRALRRMGYSSDQMCAHGFRAVARTQMDEELGIRIDLIEHQLSHAVFDPLGRAYNRTTFLKERKKMMQQWADYLDKLRLG